MSKVIERRDGTVAIVTLNYEARRNALALDMRRELHDVVERIEGDAAVRAVVLTGAGSHFCAGGDISDMSATEFAAGRERFRITHALVRQLVGMSKPVVAAVEGYAVGAGLSLALCCDTVVAGTSAKFASSFGRIGLVADFGLLHTLPRRIGEGRARQMFLYGELTDAATAERIGLIDHLVADGAAFDVAMGRARVLAEAASLPIALTKSYLATGLADALEWERNIQSGLFTTADHAEGKAAFLGKRHATFEGR